MRHPTNYGLRGYGDMMAPSPRMDGYSRALRLAVHPQSTVLDIGAGTGIFSLLACQFGAHQVHAVEPDDVIALAQSFAVDNHCADRIIFHQKLSTQVTLPIKADVIVSDLRGVMPFFEHHIPAIIDARQRLLATAGVLIPVRDTLYASIVQSPERCGCYREPWLRNQFGLDLRAGYPPAVNTWRKVSLPMEQLLTPPQAWTTLDYRTITSPDVAGQLAWTAERAGMANGLCVWFDAELADGIGFSNAPGQPELIYGQAFFPLQKEVAIEAGDRITVALAAHLVGDDYIMSWRTRIESRSADEKANFRQSTFYSQPVSLARIKRTAAHFVPPAFEELKIDRHCLALADGTTCLGDIAKSLVQAFPHRFPSQPSALAHAADLLERYAPQFADSGVKG